MSIPHLVSIKQDALKEYFAYREQFDDYCEEYLLGNNQGGSFLYYRNQLLDAIKAIGELK